MPRSGLVLQVTGALATAPVQLIGPSPNRQLLVISIDAGVGYVSTSQGLAAAVGFPLTSSTPLTMTYTDFGEVIRAAWYGSADTSARKFGIIDVNGDS